MTLERNLFAEKSTGPYARKPHIDELDQKNTNTNLRIDNLNVQVDNLDNKVDNINAHVEDLEKKNKATNTRIDNLGNQVNNLETQVGDINTHVEELEEKNETTNVRVDNLENQIGEETKNLQNQIDTANEDRKSIWDKIADLVDKSTNQTIEGIKTFTSTIVGNISGNAGTATKLQTAHTINGVTFDGTEDISVKASNDSDIVHKSGVETITGAKTFDELHFSSDTPKTPLEIDTNWTANAHYVKMTNGVLSIYIQGIRPKTDGFTGASYPVVAKLPEAFRKYVSDHGIPFMWSNYQGGAKTYSGTVEKSTGNITLYLMPNTDKINANHRFSVYISYIPV